MSSSVSPPKPRPAAAFRSIVCLGEAMVMLAPDAGRTVETAEMLRQSVGGAEANVARVVSSLGVPASFVSRVGDDPFGRLISAELRAAGVDDSFVEIDPERPTGLYVKAPGAGGSQMHYYRSGSAATALSAALLTSPAVTELLTGATVVHTSGITAAVLAAPADLVDALSAARAAGALVSVDVNFRPTLWRGRAIQPLYDLLAVADLVLVGADEAREAFGTDDPNGLREHLGSAATMVVKSDAHAVIASRPDGETTTVPALSVDVVEPVGAGDAFAGGLIGGLSTDLPLESALRLGHLCAAAALISHRDQAAPPTAAVRERLIAADPGQWSSVRVGPDGFDAPFLRGLAPTSDPDATTSPGRPRT